MAVVDTGLLNPTLSTTPESRHITSAMPESLHVTGATAEFRHVMAATPEFPDVMAVLTLLHTLHPEAATATAPPEVAVTICELSPMLRPRRLFPNSACTVMATEVIHKLTVPHAMESVRVCSVTARWAVHVCASPWAFYPATAVFCAAVSCILVSSSTVCPGLLQSLQP